MADGMGSADRLDPRNGRRPATKAKPRIKDVAQVAGVSVGTVSNVINERAGVDPELRLRVRVAIEQLGYVRSESGRQLRVGHSRLVALVAVDAESPVLGAIAVSAEQVVREAGLGLMIGNIPNQRYEAGYLELLVEQQVRGVLFVPGSRQSDGIPVLRKHEVPFVVVGTAAETSMGCSVSTDDALGGELAIRHLLTAGHRRIVCVTGPARRTPMRERWIGARRAFESAGVSTESLPQINCTAVDVASGRDAGARLLGLSPRPTAVFCVDDVLALGVLQTLWSAGVRVPHDIALVGYDEIELAAAATVPLSSIRQPAALLGRTATELLLDEMNVTTGAQHRHQSIVLHPELVVRESTRGTVRETRPELRERPY